MQNMAFYHSLNDEMHARYGQKIYKLSLDGGFSCPNRDGTLGRKGCVFCSEGGSGDFASSSHLSISQQVEDAKDRIKGKTTGSSYIAYFQAYSGTYAPLPLLRKTYFEAISLPEIKILSIATRPDCLPPDVLNLLEECNAIKPVWIELGLQTIHEKTASRIRRGYPLSVFCDAVYALHSRGIEVIVHVILGLPGEGRKEIQETVRFLSQLPIQGIKFHLLHVLKGTSLYEEYLKNPFPLLSLEEYTNLLIECIELLPPRIVIHRITGDGPKSLLVGPTWSANKKHVLNFIHHEFRQRCTYQGRLWDK